MAINFTRLGTRLGHVIASLNEANTYRGTTLVARTTTIAGDYTSVNPDLPTDIYTQKNSGISALSGWNSYLGQLVSRIIIDEVTNDRNLTNPSLQNCLVELDRQMRVASESFNISLSTIGSVTNVGSPTTDPVWVTTAKDGTGVVQDLILADSYLLRVTADSQRGGTKYGERISISGHPASPSALDYNYPTGSGVDTSFTLVDPAQQTGVVTDPSFTKWTVANTPDNWALVSGTVAGTNVFRVADDPRDASAGTALRLVSSASNTYKLRQAVTLQPNTVYAAVFKYKPVANAGATTSSVVAALRLVDGSGTLITDDAGTNNTFSGQTHAARAIGSGWIKGYGGIFITPKTLPAVTNLEITFTADATGAEGYVDHVNMRAISPLYTAGPSLIGWSGLLAGVEDDAWTWAVTLTTGSVSDYVIRGLDRLIGLRSQLRLPTNVSPTIADAVIT